jgi:EXLDI family protein
MPNKTIYVSDDDISLLDRAQELSGSNLSSTIALALRRFVIAAEATGRGYREIAVRVGDADGIRRQRFRGRRLARWRHVAAQNRRAELFCVYQTEKGRFAVHIQHGPDWVTWNDPEDDVLNPHLVSWQDRVEAMRRLAERGRDPRQATRSLVPPRPGATESWREAWPTSGGNVAEAEGVEARLEVHDSIASMREHYPAELCDLVARALDTPEIEDLDI